ncbi:hypothetical protein BCR42DRAFT_431718 [Absidia repens]|uniref:Uncharacterized protein n=1 Tax=Absidia repens TaxID=90262 RepID=A0A1X2J2K9_9FUNG|nr:hypothetical protein BCR42DRAFT_431718 [Absidia repens]
MGASHSKSQSNKQQRKTAKAKSSKPAKPAKIKNVVNRQSPNNSNNNTSNNGNNGNNNNNNIETAKVSKSVVTPTSSAHASSVQRSSNASPSPKSNNSSIPFAPQKNDVSVGIDMYTTGTPSILIRDHIANQPLSSLFPNDIPLAETLASPPQSTITSFSSANSSTVSTLSDLFSTASIETPNSTLSATSRYTKRSTSSAISTIHVPHFGDGPSFTAVTPINEPVDNNVRYTTTDSKTSGDDDDSSSLAQQVHVAQSKINGGHESLIYQGFQELLFLAESLHCVEAYYPLAECYYLGYHHPSRQPDNPKHYNGSYMSPLSTIPAKRPHQQRNYLYH